MHIDPTTLADLSVFHEEDDSSVFHRLDYTRTSAGRDALLHLFRHPLATIEGIRNTQSVLRCILERLPRWPDSITNGTLLVVERFLDYQMDTMPASADALNSRLYRLMHGPDFSLARYSLSHLGDLVAGMRRITELFADGPVPARLERVLSEARMLLRHRQLEDLCRHPEGIALSTRDTVRLARFFHQDYRRQTLELVRLHSRLDAWYSMARAMEAHQLRFPEIMESEEPCLEAEGLFHLLLDKPVAYDLRMDPDANFIFLTGANMAGKSTLIKSVGLAVYLAHLGMGVPARRMRLTPFDGILSNINVSDNIAKGESYFYNEVRRVRHTVETVSDGRRWLVLIDEIFKGTNIQDAMKCSLTVIQGLIRIRRALFILSTHLYEIGEELREHPNICFRHFETRVVDEQLEFSYHLREGISQDRFGYLILKREKVVELLERL